MADHHALERRKASLRVFYDKHDPGRIKNIDPIFEHFKFDSIFQAIKKKYGLLPHQWEYEPYFDMLGKEPDKKIMAALTKASLDVDVIFPKRTRKQSNQLSELARGQSKRELVRKASKNNVKKRQSDLDDLEQSPKSAGKGTGEKKYNPRPPPGPPPKRKGSKDKDSTVTLIKQKSDPRDIRRNGSRNARGTTKNSTMQMEIEPIPSRKESRQDVMRRKASRQPFLRKESKQTMIDMDMDSFDNSNNLSSLSQADISDVSKENSTSSPLPMSPRRTNPEESTNGNSRNTGIKKVPPPPPSYDLPGSPLNASDTPNESTIPKTASPVRTTAAVVHDSGSHDDGKNQQTSEAGDDNTPSSEHLEKYKKMVKAGLPEGAILNCMQRDGFDPKFFYLVDGSQPPPFSSNIPKANTSSPNTFSKVKTSPPSINTVPKVNAIKNTPRAAQRSVISDKNVKTVNSAPVLNNNTGNGNNDAVNSKSNPTLTATPAKPNLSTKKNVSSKFLEMHKLINKSMGLEPAPKQAEPIKRTKQAVQVSSNFSSIHDILSKQMGGGSSGPKPSANANKAGDTAAASSDKAQAVASKFAQMKAEKGMKVLPPDAPEYEKYRKMQKTGLPEGAIRNCLERDGFDPEGFFNPQTSAAGTASNTENSVMINTAPVANSKFASMQQQLQNQMQTPSNNTRVSNVQNQPNGSSTQGQMQVQSQQQNDQSGFFQPSQQQQVQGQVQSQTMQGQVQGYNYTPMMQQAQMQPMQQQVLVPVAVNPQAQNLQGFYTQLGYVQSPPMNHAQSQYMQMQGNPMNGNSGYFDQSGYFTQAQSPNNQSGYFNANNQSGYFGQNPAHNQSGYFQQQGQMQVQQDKAWSVEWSDQYKRPYYFNKYTGESTWTVPPDM